MPQILKTHCVHGHAFEGENLYTRPNGFRSCRACLRANSRRYERRKAETEGRVVKPRARRTVDPLKIVIAQEPRVRVIKMKPEPAPLPEPTEEELLEKYGPLIREAVWAFGEDPSYVADMVEACAVAQEHASFIVMSRQQQMVWLAEQLLAGETLGTLARRLGVNAGVLSSLRIQMRRQATRVA